MVIQPSWKSTARTVIKPILTYIPAMIFDSAKRNNMSEAHIDWKSVLELVKDEPDDMVVRIPFVIPRTFEEREALPVNPDDPLGVPLGFFGSHSFTVREIKDKANEINET